MISFNKISTILDARLAFILLLFFEYLLTRIFEWDHPNPLFSILDNYYLCIQKLMRARISVPKYFARSQKFPILPGIDRFIENSLYAKQSYSLPYCIFYFLTRTIFPLFNLNKSSTFIFTRELGEPPPV
ncbi:hypothetical protein SAM19_03907 [Brevibacillus laterosporus]|nr:hypothetical protein [Brevibacillus laterosporus]